MKEEAYFSALINLDTAAYDLFSPLPFNPAPWSHGVARDYATCWTYALGDIRLITTQTQAWNPGNFKEPGYIPADSTEYVLSCIADGLDWTFDQIDLTPGTYPVALFCATEPNDRGLIDHHWFRMNPDGSWSDKTIGAPPKIFTETNGTPIYELDELSLDMLMPNDTRREYAFTSYFNVPRNLSMPCVELFKRIAKASLPHHRNKTARIGMKNQSLSEITKALKPKRNALLKSPSLSYVIPQA